MAYNKENNLVIVAIYKPPNAPTKAFKESLSKIKAFKDKFEDADILMFGDTNLKFIDWKTETIRKVKDITQTISSEERNSSNILLDFVNENLLVQMVTENTRKGKTLLDIILTSDEDLIFDVKVESTNLDTDHDMVSCQLLHNNINSTDTTPRREKKTIDNLNFQKAEWTKIREELSLVKWSELLPDDMTVGDMCDYFEKQVTTTCAKHTPERKGTTKGNSVPRNRLKLIRKRKKVQAKINYMKYVKPPSSQRILDKQINKKHNIEGEIKQLIKEELDKKEIDAIMRMKKNPKYFYAYVKKFHKSESRVGPLEDDQGNLQADPENKANLLQDQYIKVFSNPEKANTDKEFQAKTDAKINDITITIKDITDAIKEIPTYAAPGPDKLPAVVLKECADQLAEAILKIWRKSIDIGQVPDSLKLQTIIPLFKKGSKSLAENYRPVSLTSHLIKLLERVLRKKLIKHIEDNKLLSNNQHAFRAGRSCVSQLLVHMEFVLHALENNKNIDVVYLDFAKAFDKVDHVILMKKVKQFGITGKIYTWIESFLANRYQQVLVENKLSRKERVVSGVPQGTVLGPLLFLIYINDLEDALKNSILQIFADDSKIVKELESKTDHEQLQEDLDISLRWAEENNMELNKNKFQLMQFGKEENLKEPYTINESTILEKEKDIKDLGVYISEDVSWRRQLTESVKKGRKYMWWILRSFKSRSAEVIIQLYQAYVLPRLEYGSILWSPYLVGEIAQLEAIQRTVTSKVKGCENLNYHQRLRKLRLYSLQRRRERFQAIYMFKIANSMVPNNLNFEFYMSRMGLKCHYKLIRAAPTHLSTVHNSFFSATGPRIFNTLPAKVKEAGSLDVFKSRLDNYLATVPDLPPTTGYPSINRNSLLDWATGNYNFADVIYTLAVTHATPERGAAVKPDGS